MNISVFDLFTIGIDPSSSRTIGPVRAVNSFVALLEQHKLIEQLTRIKVDLYGSLGATGRGHGTDVAVMFGLLGEVAERVDVDSVDNMVNVIRTEKYLSISGHQIAFNENSDLLLHRCDALPQHSNGVVFSIFSSTENELLQQTYFSIGGGFVRTLE